MTEYRFATLSVTKTDGVLDVVLNRPDARNAINRAMDKEYNRCLDLAASDPGVRAVMVRGSGRVFSAGHDLKEVDSAWHSAWETEIERSWYFYKPLIAGVHGFVGPAANAWLATFDFIIAAAETKFSLESIRGRGTAALRGAYALWMTQLPMRVVYKLNLMGGWYSAEQALTWQCVQRVVPVEELEYETRRWAKNCASIHTARYAETKRKLHLFYERLGMLGDGRTASGSVGEPLSDGGASVPNLFDDVASAEGVAAARKQRDANYDEDIIKV
jgi:enoyl-CoA hydratase/carnithine racemase